MTRTDFATLEAFAADRLEMLEETGLRRELQPTARGAGAGAVRSGREMISFCDNDYLGLSMDPRVIEAGARALRTFGAGAGASRLVTGDHPLNHELETMIARLKGLPAARVFGSGYLANIGVVPVLVGPGDLIVMDELSHSCLHAGARLSGARVERFRHNDAAHAGELLTGARGRSLVITETVFSMDGDIAPLADLAAVCARRSAWLMTDDAHGFGVVEVDNPAPIQVGTLSKAVGAYGGYVAGPAALIDLLASRARSLVYTTGLPPSVLASALASIEIMSSEPQLAATCLANARLFASLIGHEPVDSAIVPVVFGETAKAMHASEALAREGYLVSAIRPPTVPEGTARLRFTFSATHREADVRTLAALVLRQLEVEKVH